MTIADLERMSNKFVIAQDGCWIWQGAKNKDGYGLFWAQGAGKTAHKQLYQDIYGVVPEGLVLDHERCDNRACINPKHLVPKTDWENRKRSNWYGNNEFCKRGHSRLLIGSYTRSSGKKECRGCRQLEMERYYKKKHKEVSSKGGNTWPREVK